MTSFVVGRSKYGGGWRWERSAAIAEKSAMTDIVPATDAEAALMEKMLAANQASLPPSASLKKALAAEFRKRNQSQ